MDVRIVYLGILSCNLCEEEWFVVGLPPHLGKGRHWIFYVRVICVGATNGEDNWTWSCAIIAEFCCSFYVISVTSAVVASKCTFDGELSWVEEVDDVEIKEK